MSNLRVNCVAYGCLNTKNTKPGISFFKLPFNVERRSKWLHLISREDLMDKPPHHYKVCEEHFDARDILPGTQRKKLKSSSLPFHHPVLEKKDAEIQTEPLTLTENCTQTEETMPDLANNSTQSSKSLSTESSRKRKLKSDLLECKKVIKLHEVDRQTETNQINIFHKLCERFLTKELAETVKAQTSSK